MDHDADGGGHLRVPAPVRSDGTAARALVVDDEPGLAEVVARSLARNGWSARAAVSGETALVRAREFRPDVVVLDVMLPDVEGLEVLRRLRAQDDTVAVLFLTARGEVADRVAGIAAGGDDYVVKPFSTEEVLARLAGLVRRSGRLGPSTRVLEVGDLVLDEDAHRVTRAGVEIGLTATEYEVLRLLMRHAGRVLSKAQILDGVWRYDFGGNAHVVELYISYLRRKIDAGREPVIHTVRGSGYLVRAAP
ncbi:response regulator transcription factor [Jatrophihabitans sp. YIM 134969]